MSEYINNMIFILLSAPILCTLIIYEMRVWLYAYVNCVERNYAMALIMCQIVNCVCFNVQSIKSGLKLLFCSIIVIIHCLN